MKRTTRPNMASIAFVAALAASFAAQACGGGNNPTPPTSSTNSMGGGGGATTSASTGGGGGDPACTGKDGCYACAPQNNAQILQACTSAQCSPFDNVARLPLYNNGDLPPVP